MDKELVEELMGRVYYRGSEEYTETVSARRRDKICKLQKQLSDALVEIKQLKYENEELKQRIIDTELNYYL